MFFISEASLLILYDFGFLRANIQREYSRLDNLSSSKQHPPVITADAPAIASLRIATAEKLTATYGIGPWSGTATEKGVLFTMRRSSVYIARQRGQLIAMLALGTRKPWAIDRKYFSPCDRPLYLTDMAVAPELQRQGIGRLCVEAAKEITKEWPADAIFLDAYDAKAGAGEFYRKCGFREAGRASYRGVPLVYFEMSI